MPKCHFRSSEIYRLSGPHQSGTPKMLMPISNTDIKYDTHHHKMSGMALRTQMGFLFQLMKMNQSKRPNPSQRKEHHQRKTSGMKRKTRNSDLYFRNFSRLKSVEGSKMSKKAWQSLGRMGACCGKRNETT